MISFPTHGSSFGQGKNSTSQNKGQWGQWAQINHGYMCHSCHKVKYQNTWKFVGLYRRRTFNATQKPILVFPPQKFNPHHDSMSPSARWKIL